MQAPHSAPQRLDQIYELQLPQVDLSVCPPEERAELLAGLESSEFVLTIGNDLDCLPPLLNALSTRFRDAGICDEAIAGRLTVALEEALVNAIVHGNLEISSEIREQPGNVYEKQIKARRLDPRFRRRRVRVICRYGMDEASLTVRDEGPGFDVASLPDPTDAENLSRAYGRGILLMRAFFDEVRYNPVGNAVTLLKRKSVALGAVSPAVANSGQVLHR